MNGYVEILPSSAKALDAMAIFGDIGRFIEPERAAWIAAVLHYVEDSEVRFPHGKWALIQSIESQVAAMALSRAIELGLTKVAP